MIQFKPYPIYVVYSKKWREVNQHQRAKAFERNDHALDLWLATLGDDLVQLNSDNPSVESRAYETSIVNSLKSICSTPIGRTLFTAFRPDKKVFIIPKTIHDCPAGAGACAWQYEYEMKAGGGFRIWYNPEEWSADYGEDALFHELCHIYRGQYSRRIRGPGILNEFPDLEEFYAFHMETLYRSSRGKTSLRYTYISGDRTHPSFLGNKSSIYQHIVDYIDFVSGFKHLLKTDTLARLAATWNAPDYNPFRDYKILERLCLERLNREIPNLNMKTIPEFLVGGG